MNPLTGALRSIGSVLAGAGRVLAAHWPQLIGLFLAGWAARMAVLWAVVLVSNVSPTVAVLLLPLAPMATLLSLVLMLRATAPSLPAFADLFRNVPPRQRIMDNLTVAGQVLIPFLAVYASAGLLRADVEVFIHDTTADSWINRNWFDPAQAAGMFDRTVYAEGPLLIGMILVALVVRKVLSLLELPDRSLGWAALAAYVEVLWVVTLAQALAGQLDAVAEWVTSRRLIAGILHWWEGVVATLSWLTAPIEAIGTLISQAGSLVVVPVAWLVIGASVYGQRLPDREFKVETHEEVTRRLKKIPSPLKRAVGQAVEPVTTPVKETLSALGQVAAAGLVPMLVICFIFVAAGYVQVLVAEAFRLAAGPRPRDLLFALEPYSVLAQRLVYFTLLLSLLAAAVDRLVRAQPSEDKAAADASDAVAPAGSTAAVATA